MAALRRMTGPQRMSKALELSVAMRETLKSRLRKQHPEWSEQQLKRELLRYAFAPKPLPPGLG
ncbi:MAG TPA: hypothetical protein VFE05_01820 [Longimicrobiaceae bacterium]|jgi:hypothetical protein|nr:hypothetical protein [Longimicrobiaceae bacterium]